MSAGSGELWSLFALIVVVIIPAALLGWGLYVINATAENHTTAARTHEDADREQ